MTSTSTYSDSDQSDLSIAHGRMRNLSIIVVWVSVYRARGRCVLALCPSLSLAICSSSSHSFDSTTAHWGEPFELKIPSSKRQPSVAVVFLLRFSPVLHCVAHSFLWLICNLLSNRNNTLRSKACTAVLNFCEWGKFMEWQKLEFYVNYACSTNDLGKDNFEIIEEIGW